MDKNYLNILLWVAVGIFAAVIVYVLLQPGPALPPGNTTNITNITPSAVANIIIISAPGCPRCDSAALLMDQLRTVAPDFNLTIGNVSTLEGDSAEAGQLVSRYDIEKLPSLIILPAGLGSEFVSIWESNVGTRESDGALVFRQLLPPYYDVGGRKITGLIDGTVIEASDCPQCMNASIYFDSLESSSVAMVFSNKTLLQENESRAQELITRYNITRLPTFILSSDAEAYEFFTDHIVNLSSRESDGNYVLRLVFPPYADLEGNRSIRGLVDAVFVVNSSCSDCFDPADLSDYLATSSGLYVQNTTTYEANSTEGAALISRYGMTRIPALLYSPEASLYPNFALLWVAENNTIESDGWYVFRAHELIGQPYQNVSG